MELYQIILLVVATGIGILYIIQRITGVGLMEKIIRWKPVAVAVGVTLKAVSGALPSDDQDKAVVVLEAACNAAKTAEELWAMGKLPKEERNEYAQLIVAGVMKEAGIQVTEQIQAIIDGGIEIMCLLLPHSVEPKTEEA